MQTTFNKYAAFFLCFLAINGASYAGLPPLTLSDPTPAIITPVYAGNPAISYSYTIKNNTKVSIPVTESVSGNSTSITISKPCTVVPAQQTCTFIVTVNSSFNDTLLPNGLIQDMISVNYNGRIPGAITKPLNVSVIQPTLNSLSISPTTATISGGQELSYTATGYFSNGAVFDVTYVTNWLSSDASVASIGGLTGIAIGLAAGSTNITGSYQSITSNTATLSVTINAYIVNNASGTIATCDISNGSLTSCVDTGSFTNPYDIAISQTRNFAYITEPGNNAVMNCNLAFTSCASTGFNFSSPQGIAFGRTGSFVYVANLTTNTVTSCQSDASTGALSSCTVNSINNAGNSLTRILIHKSGAFAYLLFASSSEASALLYCSIDTTLGTLSSCATTGSNVPSGNNSGLAQSPDGAYLYIANIDNNDIMACPVNILTGLVGSCITTGATSLTDPRGLSINQANTYAFIANSSGNDIISCELSNPTVFSNCTTALSESSGNLPYSIIAE